MDKYELHDELRRICYGRKHFSSFNTNASKYFHILQLMVITDINDNGDNVKKIDFGIDLDFDAASGTLSIDEEMKIDILVYLYLFALEWMKMNRNYERPKRNKMEICLHEQIQFIFKSIDTMTVPVDLCKKFINDDRVKRSCYFVRNVMNQYLRNTFVPLTTFRQ